MKLHRHGTIPLERKDQSDAVMGCIPMDWRVGFATIRHESHVQGMRSIEGQRTTHIVKPNKG
jgi:hypothetical protein